MREKLFLKLVITLSIYAQGEQNVTLSVKLESPVVWAAAAFAAQAAEYVVPPECVPAAYHGECHVNHIRKMQASFSWDWGPAFPSMGIW